MLKKLARKSCNINDNCCTQVTTHLSRAMSSEWRGDDFDVYSLGDTPYNGLYGEALPDKVTLFRFQGHKRIGISQAEVHV